MNPSRIRTAVATLACAAAAGGCGLGAGESTGTAELTVTRDHGSELLVRESEELRESDTVLRVLDRSAEVETRYGGGFVQSIDGLAGGSEDGRRRDWFYYVNGIEAPVGSADYEPRDGDRVWWDHHDWSTAMRSPAVVGSWPEPFVRGFEGERWSAGVYCGGPKGPCGIAGETLRGAGARISGAGESGDDEIRVLVGTWDEVGADPVAGLLRRGPQRSGVFATFAGEPPAAGLTLMDERGRVAMSLGHGAGLVAALRPYDGPPTWVVTGTDREGVGRAVQLLDEDFLRDRFAVAALPDQTAVGVPVP